MFYLLMLMIHKQSYVSAMLSKRHYSSEIAEFICPQSFFTTHSRPRHDWLKLLSMKRSDTFCHSVIIARFSNSTVLNFIYHTDTKKCCE